MEIQPDAAVRTKVDYALAILEREYRNAGTSEVRWQEFEDGFRLVDRQSHGTELENPRPPRAGRPPQLAIACTCYWPVSGLAILISPKLVVDQFL